MFISAYLILLYYFTTIYHQIFFWYQDLRKKSHQCVAQIISDCPLTNIFYYLIFDCCRQKHSLCSAILEGI